MYFRHNILVIDWAAKSWPYVHLSVAQLVNNVHYNKQS